jgi:hypothetical protein
MSFIGDDVFGQLCFYTFVSVPSIQSYKGKEADSFTTREKRVRLATIYCNRSEKDTYFLEFKSANGMMSKHIVAEFTTREML